MIKKTYTLDKRTGLMVETTVERDKKLAEELAKDCRRIRKAMKPRGVQRSAKYPYESETMAIEPEDIPYAMDVARAHGVHTEYTKTGEPIIRSREHMKAHARAFGFYERNSYDFAPLNR